MSTCVFNIPELFCTIAAFLDYTSIVQLGRTTKTLSLYAHSFTAKKNDTVEFKNKTISELYIQKLTIYFPHITSVRFQRCSFSRSVDLIAIKFKNLQSIRLQNCKNIDDENLQMLGLCRGLQRLTISGSKKVTGAFFPHLSPAVTQLTCYYCNIQNQHIPTLARFAIQTLDLSYNWTLNNLNWLPVAVKQLEAAGCALIDASLPPLSRLSSLTILNIKCSLF
jgi:aspartate carbamoyltransferase regulatory subunit